MGDAQSAQLEGRKDAAEEDESGSVEDAPTQQTTEDQSLKNKGQISEINGKADSSTAEVNGHCEEDAAADAVLPPDEDVSQTETPLKEETPLENVEINIKESPNEADVNEDITLEMTEMDAKQNDINEGFRRFFSNIGLKLTVKRGSGEIPTDVPNDTDKEEPNRPEGVEDTTKETTSENAEQNTDVNIAQETYDNDSTTCPTLTDNTSEDVLENAEENATESKAEVESDNADAAMASPRGEDANQDTTTEEEPRSTSPSSPEEEAVVSPIKRFFTTGIFSGLRKKKKLAEEEPTDKEMIEIGEKEVVEKTEQTVQDQQQDKEDISVGVEAAAVETEHEENKLKGEILYVAQKMDAPMDPLTIIITEPEVLSSEEKEKVQASPLKRLLSGSSFKKLTNKRQRSRRSSDAKLSDSGEHVSDQLLSSTETAENQKGCAQPCTETEEEDGAWASFKKLMTPKKRMKKSSVSNEETQIAGSVEEPKPSEGGQISDSSTEENKKRKDSSVSWESVLCRSGRRRSRKTSDSDDETPPQNDNGTNKQGSGSKNGAESALEIEVEEISAYSPKQTGSPSEGDGASTWKSLKRLVTPKRKAKDDDESKDNVQSDSEVTQDESSFSIKKLLPGRKKRKSAEKQDQVSSDEADKEAASGDEDSDTPAVVPLSEFDIVETEIHTQTQTYVESHTPKEADFELQQDRLDPMAEPVLPCDNLQTEAKKDQGNDDASENQATTTPAANEKSDDLTESLSKQQLSDIPEEATPASVTEDAARDDTIAEDLIEITSEAITAPEHLDTTLADETEMISAVSQLSSESSKTSGNTTPVPAEYVVEETEALLYQVVDTISTSPETVCSYELRSHPTLEASVKPTILELHRSLDTTEIHTGLKVEELDANNELENNELAASTQIASIFEVNDSVSTEILSEVPTEEFDTAGITEDEVQEVHVTHPEDSITELESIDESHNLVESQSEVNATVSTNKLPEDDLIVTDKGSLIEALQTETEPPKLDSQETDLAAIVADETKDGAMEQGVPSLTPMKDQEMHDRTDQNQAEDDDQQPVQVEDLQELADVQALTLGSEEGVSSLEKDIISEGIPADKTVTCEFKEMPLTEVSVEPEKEDELEIGVAKPEQVKVPEVSEVEQASTLDSEEGSVQSPKEEVQSEDNLPAETVQDEPKQSEDGLTEVSVEPENKELPANAMKTVQLPENGPEEETDEPKEESIPLTEADPEPVDAPKTGLVQEPEVFEADQAPRLDSEEDSVKLLEKEVISDNVPEAKTVIVEPKKIEEVLTEVIESENKGIPANVVETIQEPEVCNIVQVQTLHSEEGSVYSLEKEVISEIVPEGETDEPKEESIPLTEANPEPVDAYKTENVQELEASKVVQAPRLDSEEGSVQSTKEEVQSEDTPEVETVKDEHKQAAEELTEVSVESQNKELPANVMQTVQEPELLEAVQAPTLDSEEGSVESHEKEVTSENGPERETDEPKEESIPLTEANPEPADTYKTEHFQELEVSKVVQAPRLDSEEGSVQSTKEEVKSEDTPEVETVKDEPKQAAEELSEVSIESENKELPANVMQTVQEPELLEAVQAPTLDSEEGSVESHEKEVTSQNGPERETDEPKEESIPLTEANPEAVDAPKTEHVQELEASKVVQAPRLDSEEGSVQSPKEEVKSEDNPEVETVINKSKQAAEELTEVSVESENKELPANVMQTVQEPELLEAVQAPTLDSEEGSVESHEKEVTSENLSERETDEPKEETLPLKEANSEPVDAPKTEHVQELEAPEVVQAPRLDLEEGSVQPTKEEVQSEDIPEVETVIDEPKQAAKELTEVNVESENKELPTNVMETVQEPELLEVVQAPTLNLEEGSVQPPKEVQSEDIPEVETVIDEPKPEFSVESKNKELPANVMETVQEPELLEAVQAPTLDSEEGSVESHEKEVMSENVPERETDEHKEESIPLTEANPDPVDAPKTEHVQELQAPEVVQAPRLESEEGSVQPPKQEVKSEDNPEAETVIDEPKVSIESGNKELPVNVMETVQEPDVFKAVQPPTLDSKGSVQSHDKEVISEIVPEGETDEPKEESIPLTEANPEPVDAPKTEQVQEPEVFEAVHAPTLDLEEDSVQSLEKDNVPEVETVIDEPKQTFEGLTKVWVEPENQELPVNVLGTVQEPEVVDAVQAPTLDSEESSVFSLEKEVISEIVPEGETDEPKEESIPLTEANPEPVDAPKTEQVQEPEVFEAVHAPTLDSEVVGVQLLEKQVISDDVPEAETVTDEPKHTAEHLPEVSVEPVDVSKTEQVQEPEVIQAATLDSKAAIPLSLENKVIAEDIPVVETVSDEPKQEIEVKPEEKTVEAAKTEHEEELEGLPSDVKEHAPETNTDDGTSMCMHVDTESIEESSVQEFEKQILFDEVAKANIDIVIASVTDGLQGEGVAQPGHSVERAEDPKIESITQDVGVEQKQCIPKVVDELLALTEVCVSSMNEEVSNVQRREKTIEDIQAPCVDNAEAANDLKHEMHLSAAQVSVEGEKESEFSSTEVKTAAEEHAVVGQVVICDIKDVSAAIPEVLMEVFKEEVETAKPLEIDDKAETAEEGSVVVMMHVPLVEFEDNNIIQVQAVNDDIKSAEKIVDTVLDVGITEDKEVIDVCHGNVEKVDNLFATLEIEEEIINEHNKVLHEKVTLHVKENLPETVPESLVVNSGQEGLEQPDAATTVSEMVESESSGVEDQKEMADSNGCILERQHETSTAISDVAATAKQVTEDLMHTSDITPLQLDVSIHDQKDNLEETKAEEETSETGVQVEEVKSNQMIQTLIVTPTNTGLVDPQHTGAILSSLSSELQLNIQFGQENEPTSSPPIAERSEQVEKTDVSEVGVQAVEVLKPAKTIKQIKLPEVAVQATGTTELAVHLDSKERAVITTQPVLQGFGIQAREPEEVKARERQTSSVQETETMQPVSQTEEGEASPSPPALSEEAYDRETKAEEPAKQKEEDQDVWLDAEEDFCTQEKCLGRQAESEREGKAGFEHEVEMAPDAKTQKEESQQEMHKTVERRETDSEGEDFAVALEHPETEAAIVTTMEVN